MKKYLFLLLLVWLPFGISAQEIKGVSNNEYPDDSVAEADTVGVNNASFSRDSLLAWPDNLKSRMEKLLESSIFNRSQIGLCIYDLTADSLIFERGKQQLLRPASTEKLLTSITALSTLGGSYRFETGLYYQGDIVEDTLLKGDIYIVGGFDPAFGHDDMKAFIQALSRKGIRAIEGNIYTDVSMKDTLQWGEGWCWDDELTRLTPLLYNGKDIFMSKFFSALFDEGIKSSQVSSIRCMPKEGMTLLVSRFHTMDQILMRMMKDSDNMYAEAMFYQLGARTNQAYPKKSMSSVVVENLIRKIGLNPSDYRIADGSGLSLYNYVTPELLVKMLRYAYRDNTIYLHLYPSLPIAGIDGTLSKRMRKGSAYDNVHAKTGTVEGVSTLAGYATAPNGHIIAFSIMNQGILRSSTGRNFQDRVCQAITSP